MEDIVYTKEDLKKLLTMCNTGSVFETELIDTDFDPVKFKDFIRPLKQHFQYLYQVPLNDLPMEMDNKSVTGLINFRFSIGK